jgi:transcriptional regulator with XRE-family HTH domain
MKFTQTTFGPALRRLRRELGLSQAAVAQQLGTTQRHVSFLETGRSQPSRTMLGRLVTDLSLSAGQRASLFEASGFRNPYKQRNFGSAEVAQTLDMIEHRLLAHWPFPAFVMDADWTILRLNRAAEAMFGTFRDPENGELNVFAIFLSDRFRDLVENWEEASTSLYFRLQTAAMHSVRIRQGFDAARARGMFDHIGQAITSAHDIPIYVPVIFRHPSGARLKLTSLLGQLVSVHDALVAGFEIELMVPVDAETERCMMANLPA